MQAARDTRRRLLDTHTTLPDYFGTLTEMFSFSSVAPSSRS